MKRWIAAAVVGLFSFAALADDAPPAGDKPAAPAKAKKASKKKADPKKDDAAKTDAK